MAVDQSKVGTHMAEQMEAIEEAFGEKDGNYEIGDICTIVEVRERAARKSACGRTPRAPTVFSACSRWPS